MDGNASEKGNDKVCLKVKEGYRRRYISYWWGDTMTRFFFVKL